MYTGTFYNRMRMIKTLLFFSKQFVTVIGILICGLKVHEIMLLKSIIIMRIH